MNWTIRCHGVFSITHSVVVGRTEIAQIKTGWRSSTIRHGTREFKAKVRGIMSRSYELLEHNEPIQTAHSLPGWRTRIEFHLSGEIYTLERKSMFSHGFHLLKNNEQMGSLDRRGIFNRTANANLPESLSELQRLFIIWLALETWQADDSSAAA